MGDPDPDPNPDTPLCNCDSPVLTGLINSVTDPVVGPHDPNEIVGPLGFGDANFVSVNEALPYEILFENVSTASIRPSKSSSPNNSIPTSTGERSASAASASAG